MTIATTADGLMSAAATRDTPSVLGVNWSMASG